MDPKACLIAIAAALYEGNEEEARQGLRDYRTWRTGGGYCPTMPDGKSGDEWAERASRAAGEAVQALRLDYELASHEEAEYAFHACPGPVVAAVKVATNDGFPDSWPMALAALPWTSGEQAQAAYLTKGADFADARNMAERSRWPGSIARAVMLATDAGVPDGWLGALAGQAGRQRMYLPCCMNRQCDQDDATLMEGLATLRLRHDTIAVQRAYGFVPSDAG